MTTTTPTKTTRVREERQAELERLHDSIAGQVEQLQTSDGWAAFLEAATGFRRYSFNNLMLILAQRPDATRVAGFNQWKERGRVVRKGEKSIRILGYSTKKIPTEFNEEEGEGEEKRRVIFPILSVFDITQTDPIPGSDIPDYTPARLTGDDRIGIYNRTAEWLTAEGWEVTRAALSGEDGHASPHMKTVRIEKKISPADAALTLLHEAAHVVLHGDASDYHQHRDVYEVEAESVAFIVAGALGLDTATNSVRYVAGWASHDTDLVRTTGARVVTASHQILVAIDPV